MDHHDKALDPGIPIGPRRDISEGKSQKIVIAMLYKQVNAIQSAIPYDCYIIVIATIEHNVGSIWVGAGYIL